MCGGSEAGSYLRRIDSCITQLKAQARVTRVKTKKRSNLGDMINQLPASFVAAWVASTVPRQALRTSIKSQLLKIWIKFGDKCPRNGSKNELTAPRTTLGQHLKGVAWGGVWVLGLRGQGAGFRRMPTSQQVQP